MRKLIITAVLAVASIGAVTFSPTPVLAAVPQGSREWHGNHNRHQNHWRGGRAFPRFYGYRGISPYWIYSPYYYNPYYYAPYYYGSYYSPYGYGYYTYPRSGLYLNFRY